MSRVRVLIGGNDDWHDVLGAGARLRDILAADGHAATLHLGWGEQQLGRVGDDTRALVTYFNGPRMTADESSRIADRIRGGVGLVAVHVSCFDPGPAPGNAGWLDLIGAKFVTHPPFSRFAVACPGGHPVTDGVGDYTIDDELYVTEPRGAPRSVLATADHDGATQPMVTVTEGAAGRIVFLANGHDARSQTHPAFQRLVRQAVRWAAGNPG